MAFHANGKYLMTGMRTFDSVKSEEDEETEIADKKSTVTCNFSVWDLITEEVHPVADGVPEPTAMAWSPDGSRIAVGSEKGRVFIRQFPDGKTLQEVDLDNGKYIHNLIFSPSGDLLAIASQYEVRVWDCKKGEFRTKSLVHPGLVSHCVFSPSSTRFLTYCSPDWRTRVFLVADDPQNMMEPYQELHLATPWEDAMACYPVFTDDECVVLCKHEDGFRLWRSDSDKTLWNCAQQIPITLLSVSGDGSNVLAGCSSSAVVCDAATGTERFPALKHGGPVVAASFSADERLLATASNRGDVRIWRMPSGEPFGSVLEHPTNVNLTAFSPDGCYLATAQRGGLVRVWSIVPASERLARIPLDGSGSHGQLSPDGRYLLPSGSSWGEGGLHSTRVYDTKTWKPVGPPLATRGIIVKASMSPDLSQVATISSLARDGDQRRHNRALSGFLQVWDWRTGRQLWNGVHLESEPRFLSYNHAGDVLSVLCRNNDVFLFDTNAGTLRQQWTAGDAITYVCWVTNGVVRFCPDDRYLVSFGARDGLAVWDATSSELRFPRVDTEQPVHNCDFSPDGRLFLSVSGDNAVRIWSIETGKEEATPLEHPDCVYVARFGSDGQSLLTGCRDGKVRLWNWRTHQLLCPPMEHGDEVEAIAFGASGDWAISSTKSETRVWDVNTGKPLSPAMSSDGGENSISIPPDGEFAVLGGVVNRVLTVLDLQVLADDGCLATDRLETIGRIVSGASIHPGGDLESLTSDEWLREWRQQHATRPSVLQYAPGDLGKHEQVARSSEEQEQWSAAVFHLTRLIEARPSQWELHLRRANALRHLDRDEEAIEEYQQTIDLQPAGVEPWLNLAQLHVNENRHDDAIACLNGVIDKYPHDVRLRQARSVVAASQERWKQVMEDMREFVNVVLHDEHAHMALAAANLLSNNHEAYRETCLQSEVLLKRENDFTHARRARLCCFAPDSGVDYSEIKRDLETCLGNVNDPYFYHTRALLAYRMGEYADAVSLFQEAGDDASNAMILYFRAMTHYKLGQHLAAHLLLERANKLIEKRPAAQPPRIDRGYPWLDPGLDRLAQREAADLIGPVAGDVRESLLSADRPAEDLLGDLNGAIAVLPKDLELRRQRGGLLAQMGRWEAASSDFKVAFEYNPGNMTDWWPFAVCCLKCDDLRAFQQSCAEAAGAVTQYRASHFAMGRAVQIGCLAPNLPAELESLGKIADEAVQRSQDRAILVAMGMIAYRQGQYELALSTLPKGGDLLQRGYSPLFQAMCHHHLGNREEARSLLGKHAAFVDREITGDRAPPIPNYLPKRWLIAATMEILSREAEELIGSSSQDKHVANSADAEQKLADAIQRYRKAVEIGVHELQIKLSADLAGNREDAETRRAVELIRAMRVAELGNPASVWAAAQLRQQASPLDALDRSLVAKSLPFAQAEDIPEQLVAVVGSERLNFVELGPTLLRFSNDGKSIVAVHKQTGLVQRYDAATGDIEGLVQGCGNVQVLSCDGSHALSVEEERAKVWNTSDGQPVTNFPVKNASVCALDVDGNRIVSGNRDGSVELLAFGNTDERQLLQDATEISMVDVLLDSSHRRLITRNAEGHIRVFDMNSAEKLTELSIRQDHRQFGLDELLAASNDSQRIAVGTPGPSGRVSVWDREANDFIWEFVPNETLPFNRPLTAVALDPTGKLLITMNSHGHIAVWNIKERRLLGRLEERIMPAGGLCFHPSRAHVAVWDDKGLSLIDPATQKAVLRPMILGFTTSLSMNVDGSKLYIGAQGVYESFTANRGPPKQFYRPFSREVYSRMLTGGQYWVGSPYCNNASLALFDPDTGAVDAPLWFYPDQRRGFTAVSENGLLAAFWHKGGPVTLWDLTTRETTREIQVDGSLTSLTLSPDGGKLAFGQQRAGEDLRRLIVLDSATGEQLTDLKVAGSDSLTAGTLAFSPDGETIAYRYADTDNAQWETRRLHVSDSTELPAYPGAAEMLCFSPDNTRLAYTTNGKELIIRNTVSNQREYEIDIPLRYVARPENRIGGNRLLFAPDSRHLLLGNDNGTVYVFRCE